MCSSHFFSTKQVFTNIIKIKEYQLARTAVPVHCWLHLYLNQACLTYFHLICQNYHFHSPRKNVLKALIRFSVVIEIRRRQKAALCLSMQQQYLTLLHPATSSLSIYDNCRSEKICNRQFKFNTIIIVAETKQWPVLVSVLWYWWLVDWQTGSQATNNLLQQFTKVLPWHPTWPGLTPEKYQQAGWTKPKVTENSE